jgi:hypothetical protein
MVKVSRASICLRYDEKGHFHKEIMENDETTTTALWRMAFMTSTPKPPLGKEKPIYFNQRGVGRDESRLPNRRIFLLPIRCHHCGQPCHLCEISGNWDAKMPRRHLLKRIANTGDENEVI